MEGKAFLNYLLSANRITEKQAEQCWEKCISQNQELAKTLIQEGYLSVLLLKQYALEFKNPTPSHPTVLASSPLKEETNPFSSQTKTSSLPVVQEERYTVLKTLGEGGMGVVQLVKDNLLDREVALKKIKANPTQLQNLSEKQKAMLWRLNKEASITAILEHPNIVPLYEMQQQEAGAICFTMRKVEGHTLREILKMKREGQKTYDENKLLGVYLKVCDAMAYAHSKEVVHRDLKPDNIMVGQFGEVYVMDWGIAKKLNPDESDAGKQLQCALEQTTIGESALLEEEMKTIGGMGTEGYMAPEQREKAALVTAQSDVYALGNILRECFTLLSPSEEFKKQIEQDRLKRKLAKRQKKMKEDSLEKSIPKEVLAIIEKATKNEPKERYVTVEGLRNDLEAYQKNLRVSAKEYSVLEHTVKWLKKNKQKIFVGGLVMTFCLTIILYFQWDRYQERQKQNQERQKQNQEMEGEFKKTYERFLQEKAKAEKSQEEKKFQESMEHLLNALNAINKALFLNPKKEETQQEKCRLEGVLVELCFENKNELFGKYFLKELSDELEKLGVEELKKVAKWYLEEKIFEETFNCWKYVKKLEGESAEYLEGMAKCYTEQGNSRYEKGEIESAIADYDSAIKINAEYEDASYRLGIAKKEETAENTKEELFEGWNVSLWKSCWKESYMDFSEKDWGILSSFKQRQLARKYQEWYAKEYNKGEVKKTYEVGGISIEMRLIPPGKYWQGSPLDETGRESDEKQRKVWISKAFWCGKYEVTQKQWFGVMKNNPSNFKGEKKPVEQVSWEECQEFCKKTEVELLSEAQWEYACRGGVTGSYNFGKWDRKKLNSASSWTNKELITEDDWEKLGAGTTEVGKFEENGFGLYDMHGNVWEWCKDAYKSSYGGDATNPISQGSASSVRVYRGGCWRNSADSCRCAFRSRYDPSYRWYYLGFRPLMYL
ncbi:MAG: SUMF1/EgtB/PvdO family nonheme iron enzyme [Planctomycetota bacterium]